MYVSRRGMTLIDVLVGTAIAVAIFLGIFGLLRASAVLSAAAANKATALSLANSTLEQIRSLPYASIGTVGGIPSGTLPQEATSTIDNVPYVVRTFISYYDDPKDGSGASDTNGVTTDYKRAKVTVSYETQTGDKELSVVSTFSPKAIETTTGGGTLRIVAVDSLGGAVSGAEVHVVNASTSPAIDLTTFTDALGSALLPGAATSTGYRITVTKSGWSTAQTYSQTSQNQNPSPGHLTIAQNQTTTGTFAIDVLASLMVRSLAPIVPLTWSDTFATGAGLASMVSTTVTGGAVTLSNGGTGYASAGTATATSLSPSYLAAWHSASFATTIPVNTSLTVQVVDGSGTLIPDASLLGNASGFTSSPINLSTLSTTTYPSLALRASLASTATSSTPSLLDWSIDYSRGPVPIPNVSFTLTGAKTIGSTVAGASIYKTTLATTTGAAGLATTSLEWDAYSLSVPSYTVVASCPSFVYEVDPGTSGVANLYLATTTGNALAVTSVDASGNGRAGTVVTLSRPGFSRTFTTDTCGFAYFSGLTSASDYSLSASSSPLSGSDTNISVSGLTPYELTLH